MPSVSGEEQEMRDHNDMLRSTSKLHRGALKMMGKLPEKTRSKLNHQYRREALHRYLQRKVGPSFRVVDPRPSAPPELVGHTSAMTEHDIPIKANPDEYFGGAYDGTLYFLQILEKCSFNLRTVGSILDFGCGTGKNIRLYRCIDGVRLVGTDVNPKVIEWARENVSGVEFHLNDLDPPLTWAEDDSFDLVTAGSVFTHIPLDRQEAWLVEIRRVLRPGAYFLCTLAGAFHAQRQLSLEQRAMLAREGRYALGPDDTGVSLASTNIRQEDVFQTKGDALAVFKRVFTVLDHLCPAHGQEILVLQKEPTTGRRHPLEGLPTDRAPAKPDERVRA